MYVNILKFIWLEKVCDEMPFIYHEGIYVRKSVHVYVYDCCHKRSNGQAFNLSGNDLQNTQHQHEATKLPLSFKRSPQH